MNASTQSKKQMIILSALSFAFIFVLGACTHAPKHDPKKAADYWQRSDTTSALYTRGPKAQHMLHQDIASCVAEVRELIRLGSIREVTPPDSLALTGQMKSNWDSPYRDGPMYTEYLDYHDFETCMQYKGWARVDYVKPDVAKRAIDTHNETILGIPTPSFMKDKNEHRSPRGQYEFNN
jgi:hypothetical protein